jgi:hypothetical protein
MSPAGFEPTVSAGKRRQHGCWDRHLIPEILNTQVYCFTTELQPPSSHFVHLTRISHLLLRSTLRRLLKHFPKHNIHSSPTFQLHVRPTVQYLKYATKFLVKRSRGPKVLTYFLVRSSDIFLGTYFSSIRNFRSSLK